MHVEINSSCNYIFYRIEETSEYIILFNTLNNIDKYIMDEELTVHIYINNNSIGEDNYDRRSLENLIDIHTTNNDENKQIILAIIKVLFGFMGNS